MENYEEFIERKMSQMTNNDEKSDQANSQWSSKIRFYGFPILPPLLNKDQKEEMQILRKASARIYRKNMSSVSRMSCIQAFLDSVELRKAPTFEEFRNETRATSFTSPSNTECHSFLYIPGSKDDCNEIKANHWNSNLSPVLPSVQKISSEKLQIPPNHPLAYTACGGHTTLNVRPLQAEDSFQSSHKTVLFEEVPFFRRRPEKAVEVSVNYEPDSQIYSGKHPLSDVSHQALSSGYVTNETSHFGSSFVEGTAITTVGTEGRHSDFGGFFLNSSNMTNKVSDIISHAPVDAEVLEEECTASSQPPSPHVAEQPAHPPVEVDPADGPYRMSLQNLLKKSQEHRRRQRLLRSQAKALKACEIGYADKHSLSDKENEEVIPAGIGKPELKRNREKRKDQENQALQLKILSQDGQTCAQVGGKEIVGLGELVSDVEITGATKFEGALDHCLNITSSSNATSSMTGKALPPGSNHPHIADSPPQSSLSVASTSAKCLYQSKGKKAGSMLPRPCLTLGKKFKNVPTPKFCLSPVRSKKGSGVSSPARKPLVKRPVCVDEAASGPCGLGRDRTGCVAAGAKETIPLSSSVHQAEQISQLEVNLSSLKLLISDLESTLKESQVDDPQETAMVYDSSRGTVLTENAGVSPPAGSKPMCMVTFSMTAQKEVTGEDCGMRQESKEHDEPHCVTSLLQKMRVPEVFHTIDDSKQHSQRLPTQNDSSNQPGERKEGSETAEDSFSGTSLNRSYDVDSPSGLWLQAGPMGKQLTPELGGQEGVSRAKRRLLMNTEEGDASGQHMDDGRPQYSTHKTWQLRKELRPQIPNLQKESRQRQELRKAPGPQVPHLHRENRQRQELRKTPGPQVPDLQEEQRQQQELRKTPGPQVPDLQEEQRQQQELLQSLAARYQFLRSVSFLCSAMGSRLEDTVTSSPPTSVSECLASSPYPGKLVLPETSALTGSCDVSQSRGCLPVCYRPLVAAAVKGYLTRRLFRTERVAQLIRTIKDTQVFLQGFQSQTPGREYSSRQDQLLQERVTLQLRSTRYELHDLFFSLSPAERMQVISWDRQLTRERELRHKVTEESSRKDKDDWYTGKPDLCAEPLQGSKEDHSMQAPKVKSVYVV
ncbi:hypothetical protein P4O66_006789 [Electrophorus voltai]|uniref:Uncharacterized protein n=1 Tax=Electrophorus voltai TaxID=2609070 RepID=A0AAD8ZG66_9TELE|nr:hypothetical protein P4O66_006789 [Electrophorus voltai]